MEVQHQCHFVNTPGEGMVTPVQQTLEAWWDPTLTPY